MEKDWTLTEVKMGLDLVCQYRPAPALRDVLRAIPVAQLGVVELLDPLDDVAPGNWPTGR